MLLVFVLFVRNKNKDIKYDNPNPKPKVIPIDLIKKKLVNANKPKPIKLVKNENNIGRISAESFVLILNIV